MVRRCEVCGNGTTRGMVWLSSSRRKLAHQQFVSVGIKHNKGRANQPTLNSKRASQKKKKAKRKTVKQKKKHARQHRHGAVGHGADEVDREALVEPAPALKVYDLPRGANDAGALARRARGEQQAALRLQTRAHDFVRVCGHRCGHLCHRGAKQNRMRRYWPIVAMPFCTGKGDT